MSLNYGNVFKIQHVRNPFALNPVSFSSLASYLECPGCALEQRRKRRPKEPARFTNARQSTLFGGKGEPDPRLVGTLLHTCINLLHETNGPLSKQQQEALLTDQHMLTGFICYDLLTALREAGKMKLAMFLDELLTRREVLYSALIAPMQRYRRELASTDAIVLAAAERFQFKLVSTRNTFIDHGDRGGAVGLVGEFDQIRLRKKGDVRRPTGVPAIMEFKKGFGRTKKRASGPLTLFPEEMEDEKPADELPGMSHAMQLIIYWMAFQTRWDILDQIAVARGGIEEIRMPLQQELDLIIYNLNDGCQYQLLPTNLREALQAMTNCIFYLDWAMKSGYAQPAAEHECKKTQLIAEVPNPLVEVGYTALSAAECYALARDAFECFKQTVRWEKLPL